MNSNETVETFEEATKALIRVFVRSQGFMNYCAKLVSERSKENVEMLNIEMKRDMKHQGKKWDIKYEEIM